MKERGENFSRQTFVNATYITFQHAMAMWKYILAFTFSVIGIVEIVLALNAGLREALMKTSPVRLKHAESSAFLLAGISDQLRTNRKTAWVSS